MMANNGPLRKRTLLEDTINGEEQQQKKQEKKSTAEYDGLSVAENITKAPVEKKETVKKTNTSPFKPRTLLETTIARSNDNTKANTNNRFESRFTPRTERTGNADGLSQANRFLALDKKEIERDRKETELAKRNPNSLYYKQHFKKRFYNIEERGYKEGVTKELNELSSGLNEPKIREKVTGNLTDEEAYIVKGMQDYEKNHANETYDNIGKVDEYGLAPAQFMSEQEINNYMYLLGKYDKHIADLYYRKTDAYHKYHRETSSAKAHKGFYEAVKENPAIGYIAIPTLTVASGIMGLMAGAEQTVNKVTGKNTLDIIDEEAAFKTDATGLAEQAIEDSTDNKFLKQVHRAGTELVEELGENMLPGGEKVWGTGAGITRKYSELAQYGVDLSSTEAYIAAMTSGGMNAVDLKFTKSGGQKLGKALTKGMAGGTLKTVIGNTAGSVLSGMGAQATRALVDNIVDATILEDNGRYATVYKQYIAEGLTEAEAEKKAVLDAYVTPVVNAAVMGGIFGSAVSVPGSVGVSVDFTKRGVDIKNELYHINLKNTDLLKYDIDRSIEDAVIRQGLKQDKNSDAYKNAKLLEDKVNNKKALSNSQIGAQDILNQMEVYKTYEYKRAMEELTGARIELDANLPPEADGSYLNGVIKVSADNEADARSIIDHEEIHHIKDGANDVYTAYEARLKDNVTFSKVTDSIKAKHKDAGKTIDDKTAESEAAAEIGMALMPKTVEDLNRLIRRVEGNRTLYDRVYESIRDLRAKMYAKGKKTFVDSETGFKVNYGEMLKLEKTLEDALTKVRGAELGGEKAKEKVKDINYLTSEDNSGYLKAGNQHTRHKKESITNNGESAILTSKEDTDAFIERAMNDREYHSIKAFAKAPERMISDLAKEKVDIQNYYLELNSSDILHTTEHMNEKRTGQISLTVDDIKNLPEYMVNYDDVLSTKKQKDGRVKVVFGKKINGHSVIITAVSKGRKSLSLKSAYILETSKYKELFRIKKEDANHREATATNNEAMPYTSETVPFTETSSKDIVPQSTGGVKGNSGNSADGKEHYRLKTNQDMNVYGRNVVDDLNAYNLKRGYGSAFNELRNGMLPDFIRQAWRLFESGEIADGRKLLYMGGEEIAKAVRKKKGETDHMIATDFVDHFTDLYKQSRTYKAYTGKLDIGQNDIMETSVDIPRYVAELATKSYGNTDLMTTLYIENAIRSGYRMLKNGSDDFAIREALRPAAEAILNDSKTKDGNPLRFETEKEYKAAVKKLTDDMIENYHLGQAAKNVSDSDVIKADTEKYGRDIEGMFRGIGLGITEGGVKRLGSSVRQMLDYVLEEDYSVTDFNGKLDDVIGAELTRLKLSPANRAEIANTIISELRETAMSQIGKRRLELRGIMQAEIEAGRDTSETWQKAHDELNVLAEREANLTGVYFPHGNPGNEYALRNPAKKLHKMNVGSKDEFDSIVQGRMGEMTYRVSHNKDTADYGMRYVAMNGTTESLTYLSSKQKWDENDMGIAAALVGEYGALGEPQLEADVLILAAQKATEAGKLSQAFSLMYRLTPAGNIAFLNKTENTRIETGLSRHAQKAEIEKRIKEFKAKDAEERKAADKALYETDGDYRRDSDNKTRLQLDLEAVAKGEAEAKAKIAEFEEQQRKLEAETELLAFMTNAGSRVKDRQRLKIEETFARETMREIGMSEDDIEMYLTGMDISPERYKAFIETLREYLETSEKAIQKKEAEYKKLVLKNKKDSELARALRKEIRQIAIRQRSLQNEHMMRVFRVNDDGEIDPEGRHIVTDNPKASQWEIKKVLGEDTSREAVAHYKSHVDMLYDKLGIKHTDSEVFNLMSELANALPDIDDADELMDVILITSRYRNTATGQRMEKIRSKIYRGLEKLGHRNKKERDAGKSPYNKDKAEKGFLDAVDNDLLTFIDKSIVNESDNKSVFSLGETNRRLNDEIKRLTGIDTTSFQHSIKANSVRHIINDHGENGITDNSMANKEDVARIGYVIKNFDDVELLDTVSAEYRDRNQRPAPMIKLSKRVDGTYYVVEAVPDTASKKIRVVSAYIKKASTQQTVDVQAPSSNVRNASADVKAFGKDLPQVNPQLHTRLATINGKSSPENSISQGGGKVKRRADAEPDNRMLKWLLGFGDKETNNIRRLLRKHFGDDTEQLRKIATLQMFGMIADTENVSTARKAKNIMFQSQLLHLPTMGRNILGNVAESARMNIVNNTAAAIEWLTTRKGGQRVVGFENPFVGYKEGKARSEKAYLETALNVDILNNGQSRLGAPSRKRTFKSGPLAVGERLLGYSLGATDEYFKGAIEHQVKQGLKRYVDSGRITQAEADKYAEQQILYRTYQNDSRLSKISVGLRDLGNFIGTGKELPDTNKSGLEKKGETLTHDFGAGDFINPYPLVSGNMLDRIIDVTPVGAVKALVKCGKLAKELYGNSKDLKALDSVAEKKGSDAGYKHTYDESKVSQEFIDSVNANIENAVIAKRNGDMESIPDVIDVTTLSDDSVKKISDFVGFDISGYKCQIEKDRIIHIDNRHGLNGKADQSLSDPKDIARIGYAINNIDSIEWLKNTDGTVKRDRKYRGKDEKKAPLLMVKTKIDGTFCVSQVVPDTKKKTIWITSSRIEKSIESLMIPQYPPGGRPIT